MTRTACTAWVLTAALGMTCVMSVDANPSGVAAAKEPGIQDVLGAARAGETQRARIMIQQVLASHPNSAKAHYVAAQVYVLGGDRARAKEELLTAQRIDPAMAFVDAQSLADLRQALGLGVAATAKDQVLTDTERRQVDQLTDTVQQQCRAAISKLSLPRNPPPEFGLQEFIRASDQGYCDCLGERFRSSVTPALIRNGTKQSGEDLIRSVANSCAVDRFKSAWPAACLKFAHFGASLSPDKELSESKAQEICDCVQPTVDTITADNMAETLRQTVEDYGDFQHDPSAAMSRPASLARSIQGCIAKIKGVESPNQHP